MTEAPSSNNSKDCEGNLSYISIRLLLILCVNISCPYFLCTTVTKYFTGFSHIPISTLLRCPEVNVGAWRVKGLSLNFDRQFPMILFLCLFKTTRNEKWTLKTKWITPDLVIKKPFYWFKMKIMMIKIHRIQAGYKRYHSQNLIPPKQHRTYN